MALPMTKQIRRVFFPAKQIVKTIGRIVSPPQSEGTPGLHLTPYKIELDDGRIVAGRIGGEGIPLLYIHGYTASGDIYARTLNRLKGFKIITVDIAGHGKTPPLKANQYRIDSYAELIAAVLDHFGVRRAVIAGHSFGGELAGEVAKLRPQIAIAVIPIGACFGEAWDRLIAHVRRHPWDHKSWMASFFVDMLETLPDRVGDLTKMGPIVVPMLVNDLTHPWQLAAPGIALLRHNRTGQTVKDLTEMGIPIFPIHGECDRIVPLEVALSTGSVSGNPVVVVEGGAHSFMIRDPEQLPQILTELIEGQLGQLCNQAIAAAGLDPFASSQEQVERALCHPDAKVITFPAQARHRPSVRHQPKFRHRVEPAV